MPSYKVVLKDEAKTELSITAADVEVMTDVESKEPPWFNFISSQTDDNPVTVAAIPFEHVLYIRS